MRPARDFALIALGLLLGIGLTPRAQDLKKFGDTLNRPTEYSVQFAVGQSRYTPSPDGVWWNRDQEHSNRYKTNGVMQFGAHAKVSENFGVQVDWVNLGWARTNSQAVACANDDCSKTDMSQIRRAPCNAELTGDCLYNFRGAGGIKGLKLGVTWAPLHLGPFTPELEAGLLAYKARWSIRVTPLDCTHDDRACSWTREIEQSTRCGFVCLSPEVGGTLWWKNTVGLTGQYYFRTTQHTPMTAGFGGPAYFIGLKGRVTL